jgi:hypothetical protein
MRRVERPGRLDGFVVGVFIPLVLRFNNREGVGLLLGARQ